MSIKRPGDEMGGVPGICVLPMQRMFAIFPESWPASAQRQIPGLTGNGFSRTLVDREC
jgi:hypothetical protein